MKYFILTVFSTLYGLHLVFCDNDEAKKHCMEIGKKVFEIEEGINTTYRFLRPPAEYKEVADQCQKTIDCALKVDPSIKQKASEKLGICDFYIFYNQKFATCANKLIAKKDDKIPCLDTLFNDYDEPDVNECDQWDSLQPCIKTHIESVCGEKTDDWVKQAAVFRKDMCDKVDED